MILAPKAHKTNEELAKTPQFWNTATIFISAICKHTQQTVEQAIELVALNFGRWETRQAEDPLAVNCHGHVHFYLTLTAVSTLKTTYHALLGRSGHPEDYKEEDARDLEQNRLLGDEITDIRETLQTLQKSVTSIEGKMDILLQKLSK